MQLTDVRVCRRVEEVVRYPGLPPRRQLTYQAKQTISREMEQEKMRRAEQLILQRNPAGVRQIPGSGWKVQHPCVLIIQSISNLR